jgi:hypothetical protein
VTTVLVVNHAHSAVCGIHGLGRRMAVSLAESPRLKVSYADVADAAGYVAACQEHEAEVVLVNYRSDLMGWVPGALPMLPHILKLATVHNYDLHNVDVYGQEALAHGFDRTLVLDPTVRPADPRIIGVGRAIPPSPDPVVLDRHEPPWIGSFGFAFHHKGFPTVAEAMVASLDAAVYKLHMPEAYFNGAYGGSAFAPLIVQMIQERFLDHPGLTLHHTAEHIDDAALVALIAQNDVNALMYVPGQADPGLSSALDYLIAARRPTIVTECAMFRYGWTEEATTAIWPKVSLREMLEDYGYWQREADLLYGVLAHRFADDIEAVIEAAL